jgi:hypothetical protein
VSNLYKSNHPIDLNTYKSCDRKIISGSAKFTIKTYEIQSFFFTLNKIYIIILLGECTFTYCKESNL